MKDLGLFVDVRSFYFDNSIWIFYIPSSIYPYLTINLWGAFCYRPLHQDICIPLSALLGWNSFAQNAEQVPHVPHLFSQLFQKNLIKCLSFSLPCLYLCRPFIPSPALLVYRPLSPNKPNVPRQKSLPGFFSYFFQCCSIDQTGGHREGRKGFCFIHLLIKSVCRSIACKKL